MPRHGFRLRDGFVMKEFSKINSFKREEMALKILQPHPFITELTNSYTHSINGKFLRILYLTYYKGCDLHTWIDNYPSGSPILFVRYVFKKILLAYDYAVKKSIFHRDIKPENIMIDEFGMVKLIDWELCSFNRFSHKRVGTVQYMAEEVNKEDLHECMKADIWSIGVVMFCLATGKRPYESIMMDSGFFNDEWIKAIYDKRWRIFWKSHEKNKRFPTLPVGFKYCIERMLKKEADDRCSIEEIMTDSFFLGDEMEQEEVVNLLQECVIFKPLF